jgi:hypothetical protein
VVFVFAITELVARLLLCSLNLTSSRELRTINLGIPNEFLHMRAPPAEFLQILQKGRFFLPFCVAGLKLPGRWLFLYMVTKEIKKIPNLEINNNYVKIC